jgi:hypothetical protein
MIVARYDNGQRLGSMHEEKKEKNLKIYGNSVDFFLYL